MKKKKMLKDYRLIEFFAKSMKFCKKTQPHKKEITTAFYYGEAGVYAEFRFENQIASSVSYELGQIYDTYGDKEKYPTVTDFAKAFVEEAPYFDYSEEKTYGTLVTCDLKQFNDENTVSQGLFNLAIFISAMNSFLHVKESGITEHDIRDFNRLYLSKAVKKSKLLSFASIAVFILGIVFCVLGGTSNNSIFVLPAILFLIAGILGFVYFYFRKKYFGMLLRKAKK